MLLLKQLAFTARLEGSRVQGQCRGRRSRPAGWSADRLSVPIRILAAGNRDGNAHVCAYHPAGAGMRLALALLARSLRSARIMYRATKKSQSGRAGVYSFCCFPLVTRGRRVNRWLLYSRHFAYRIRARFIALSRLLCDVAARLLVAH